MQPALQKDYFTALTNHAIEIGMQSMHSLWIVYVQQHRLQCEASRVLYSTPGHCANTRSALGLPGSLWQGFRTQTPLLL